MKKNSSKNSKTAPLERGEIFEQQTIEEACSENERISASERKQIFSKKSWISKKFKERST